VNFKEEQHPRGQGGKFAKKGEVSNSVAVPLKEHGFKMKPVNGEAHYEHPAHPGHKVSIQPVPAGFKYSSKWLHSHTEGGATAQKQGEGGKSLLAHLGSLFGATGVAGVPKQSAGTAAPLGGALSVAAPSASTKPTNPTKATPTFTHPSTAYAQHLSQFGFQPVKETKFSQTYQNAEGTQISVKTEPLKWSSKFSFKITKPGAAYPIKGKTPAELETNLHKAAPGEPVTVPAKAGVGTPAPETTLWNGMTGKAITAITSGAYEPATTYEIDDKKKLVVSETTNAWAVKEKSSYGDYYNKTLSSGYGQESFNAEFEKLHPRGAGGKFEAKPDQPEFIEEIHEISGGDGDPDSFKLWSNNSDFLEMKNTAGTMLSVDKKTGAWGIYLSEKSTSPINKGSDLDSLYTALNIPSKSVTPETRPTAKPTLKMSELKKVGEKMGSNPGGTYEDAEGKKFYVKQTQSVDHARNEKLAAALYALAGAGTLQYRDADDDKAVVTELEPLAKKNVSDLTTTQRVAAQADFATHAWLANWDAVGLSGDNLGAKTAESKPINLDLGGSLAYRAQGTPKGDKFGNTADEWNTLRDASKNASAAKLFGGMTPEQLKASADRLKKVSNGQIHAAVVAAGYEGETAAALYSKLVSRRDDVMKKATKATIVQPPAVPKPAGPPPFEAPFDYQSADSGPTIYELNESSKELGTATQRAAAKTYTGGTYAAINRALRFGYHGGEHPQAHNIKQITAWLDQASMPADTICTRRVSSDYAQFLLEVAKVGSEFTDFGFVSTSRTGTWSGNVTCQIKIPKGAKAASVQGFSQHPVENEVLIQRGSRFKVVDFNSKTQTLYCELNQDHIVKTENL
jgi:hypothetical protein